MLLTSSSSRESVKMALVSCICSAKPSLTPIIDPATAGWKSPNRTNMSTIHSTKNMDKRVAEKVVSLWFNDFTWSSMYLTATTGIDTPCLEAILFSVWSKTWNWLHPPQASTICNIWIIKLQEISESIWPFLTWAWKPLHAYLMNLLNFSWTQQGTNKKGLTWVLYFCFHTIPKAFFQKIS